MTPCDPPDRTAGCPGGVPSAETERLFRLETWRSDARQLRFVGAAGAGFYLAGGVVDWLLAGPGVRLWLLLAIRCLTAVVVVAAAVAATRGSADPARFDRWATAALAVVAVATVAVVGLSPGEVVLHALTAVAVLLVFYLFVPLRWVLALPVALGFSVAFVAVAALCFKPPPNETALVVLYLLLFNVLGCYACLSLGRSARRAAEVARAEHEALRRLQAEIAEREQVEGALAASEERYRGLVELCPYAIVVHRQDRILYVNPAGVALIGAASAKALEGHSILDLVHPRYREISQERLTRLTETGQALPTNEIEVRRLDGSQLYCEVVSGLTNFLGETAVLTVVRGVEDRKRLEEELRRLATTDPLTGVANRRQFFDLFEAEWKRSRRHGRRLSVLILDLDHFKRVNDRFGHAVGDMALRSLVECVAGSLRSEDILGRVGGEEFAVVLPEIGLEGAVAAAERVRGAVAAHEIVDEGVEITLTVSLGVTECRLEAERPDDALKRADDALYSAKQAGRNAVCTA